MRPRSPRRQRGPPRRGPRLRPSRERLTVIRRSTTNEVTGSPTVGAIASLSPGAAADDAGSADTINALRAPVAESPTDRADIVHSIQHRPSRRRQTSTTPSRAETELYAQLSTRGEGAPDHLRELSTPPVLRVSYQKPNRPTHRTRGARPTRCPPRPSPAVGTRPCRTLLPRPCHPRFSGSSWYLARLGDRWVVSNFAFAVLLGRQLLAPRPMH